ncbi:uncharacterized protein BDV17DRAFT_289215 [Aspergillus undulatus]|uniref:uncharacterized protein n=1 Tax=Aspergillus undulatus TaxID=1810928 RepID=UPI003CCDD529
MADDTREPEARTFKAPKQVGDESSELPSKPKPEYKRSQSQAGKLWEAFGDPEQQANMLPNASGHKANDMSITEAMKSLSMKNATTFYKTTCARDSLLYGIGAGFGLGGVRGVLGGMRSIWSACNWAVGAFAVTSLASHEFCRRRRLQELDGMKQAVEMMGQLKLKKQREKEEQAAEAARLAEEERKRKSWTNLSNYKFW